MKTPTTTTRRDLVTGNAPVLLELREVRAILNVTEGKVDALIRQGRLDDCTVCGPRRYFRSAQVRSLVSVM